MLPCLGKMWKLRRVFCILQVPVREVSIVSAVCAIQAAERTTLS